MNKRAVIINNWPFEEDEKAKLIWIGEPFRDNNKWVVNAYFKGNRAKRKLKLDWASIHFLSINKYYINGNLNNGESISNTEIIDINLSGAKVEYREKDWNIYGTGFKDQTKSKTFNFIKNNVLYTIPIIEIIRAVLAPDKFMLNRILEMDTLENYFTYVIHKNKLNIRFTSAYKKSLLKNEKINHLSWLLTNPKIFKMFNSIGTNLWDSGDLKFDFLFDQFSINARVEKKEKYIRILQILSLKRKNINAKEISIYHPSFEETRDTDKSKLRKYVNIKNFDDRKLNSDADGSTEDSEQINTFLFNHEYVRTPQINRVKRGITLKRSKEDENTELYFLEDDRLRTTADSGGEKIVRGLEFTSISDLDSSERKSELNEFIEILKMLEKRNDIISVDIMLGDLPEGKRAKRFAKLSDGITNRKYAIGKIVLVNGQVNCLIDIEREYKALSILQLYSYNQIDWLEIIHGILLSLTNNSGSWNSERIRKLEQSGIYSNRIKHKKTGKLQDKSEYINQKITLFV